MSDADTALTAAEAAPALAASAPEDLRPFIDEQRRMLGELAELGLRAARAVVIQAESETPPPASEIALSYARVSRAVRLCILLQGKLLDARDEEEERQERFTPLYQRKARVEQVIERLAADQCETEEHFDAAIVLAGERLDDEDLYGDLMDRPMSEIVQRLCKDLGLEPDWSERAQELWAREEIAAGQACAPLMAAAAANLARPPPFTGGEEQSPEAIDRTAQSDGGGVQPPLSFEPAALFPAPA